MHLQVWTCIAGFKPYFAREKLESYSALFDLPEIPWGVKKGAIQFQSGRMKLVIYVAGHPGVDNS